MNKKLDEMVPAIAIAIKPASLATRLAAATMTKETPAVPAIPTKTADEECYEDKDGNVIPCKKCEKNMEKNKVVNNKYMGMREKALIVNFLKSINEKNYAQAHKYLKNIMEAKLTARIAKHKGTKLF